MDTEYHNLNNGDTGQALSTGEERAQLRERLLGHEAKKALAFQTAAVKHFGPAGGIFCRQLLYRDGSGWDGDFWIYKSIDEWEAETGLKRRQQEKARKVLTGKGVMEEKKDQGPDRRQRLYFRLNPWAIMELLGDDLPHAQPLTRTQGCTVLPYRDHAQYYRAGTMPGNSAQAIQKTTQETTQEDIPSGLPTGHPAGPASPDGEEDKDLPSPASSGESSTITQTVTAESDSEHGLGRGGLKPRQLVSRLVTSLSERGLDAPDDKHKAMFGRNMKELIRSDSPTDEELLQVVDLFADFWDGPLVSPQQLYHGTIPDYEAKDERREELALLNGPEDGPETESSHNAPARIHCGGLESAPEGSSTSGNAAVLDAPPRMPEASDITSILAEPFSTARDLLDEYLDGGTTSREVTSHVAGVLGVVADQGLDDLVTECMDAIGEELSRQHRNDGRS